MPRVKSIEGIIYNAKTRRKCNIYMPSTKGPHPVLVNTFAGGWCESFFDFQIPGAQSLAKEGYASVVIDYRLAPKFKHPSQMDDVKAALDFVKRHQKKYSFDTERVGAIGMSAGGNLAALAALTLSRYDPPVKCGVSFHGVMDLVKYSKYDLDSKIFPRWAENLVHDYIGGPKQYLHKTSQRASPYHRVNKDSSPMLFITSKKDGSVPYQHAKDLAKKMKDMGLYSKFLMHPGDTHADIDPAEIQEKGWGRKMWSKSDPPKLMFHDEVLKFLGKYLK